METQPLLTPGISPSAASAREACLLVEGPAVLESPQERVFEAPQPAALAPKPLGFTLRELDWFQAQGVPVPALAEPRMLYIVNGLRTSCGRFIADDEGKRWIAIDEGAGYGVDPLDTVFWQPRTSEIAVDTAMAFCLSEHLIDSLGIFALDGWLRIVATPLAWLRERRRAIFVLHWDRAFDRLRDCPRIELAEPSLKPLYEKHMQPLHMPALRIAGDGK